MKYILASASPRRRELIQLLGLPFEIRVADVDESRVTDPLPQTNVIETARLKALVVAGREEEPAIILGADTTVALDDRMLNKPSDPEEARRMLRFLRGRTHQVHTGLVVLHTGAGRYVQDVATIDVPMRSYTDAEIEAYVATGDPLDKAGAYAIQHAGFRPVEGLAGCYAGVVGLPLCHVTRALLVLRQHIDHDIAVSCQQHLHYDCPIHQAVLRDSPESHLLLGE